MFGSFSMSSRVPAPSELSCADPEDPCRLPNAFVADPPLDQVVASTWEADCARPISGRITWSDALFAYKIGSPRGDLEIDPNNLKGLALAGTVAFQRKQYAQAAAYWERMLPLVPPDSEDARMVQQNVAEARSLAGADSAARLRGTVSLSPKLQEKASPDDVVFVFARAAEGPPMPLAVARTRVRDLPFSFRLDDSMAMTPAMKLSAFPRVVVGARVSKSGSATPQPGDLQGASAPVANDAGEVRVVIDRVVP